MARWRRRRERRAVAAADSNVLLRLLVRDDEAQYQAAHTFLRTAGRVFVSDIVLVEVVWAMTSTYRYPKPRIVAAIERILDLEAVALQDPAVVAAALEDYRSSQADFSDCMILATARREAELPLATFDARLSRLEGTRKIGARRRTGR
jgi:predicted nucleic-acid-binding protein